MTKGCNEFSFPRLHHSLPNSEGNCPAERTAGKQRAWLDLRAQSWRELIVERIFLREATRV